MEQGSQEALKQRSVGKFDRLSRKELYSKERKEKERSLSDERAKIKQKQEKKSEHQADDSQQKEGTLVKMSSEEKNEKKPKIKSEKKMAGTIREGKLSVSEGGADEGPKDATVKKARASSVETVKAEKEKNKEKSKEKVKGEKTSAKGDFKKVLRPDSAGSSEDRSDMDPGSEGSKKRDKHSKEVLKRSRSHTEDKPGDKPKSKTDGKDSDKEKTKAEPDGQKSNKPSDIDKDSKRAKPTEKGRVVEKSKSRSKEETKTLLLSKLDNKVQSIEVKSTGGASVSKPESTKEKKKDGTPKEQRKGSDEPLHEKSEIKNAKKKLEREEKVQEKREDSQEEKAASKDTLEKSDKTSVSSLSLDMEEPPKKPCLLQDASTDSDPVTTTVTTSFSDDTCDALSDIMPEPPEGEAEPGLGEMPAVPAEADALLALMDVCTSAEARLPPESGREVSTPEMTLQEADMKMKEAALTLLSMDSAVSSLMCQDTREGAEQDEAVARLEETAAGEGEEQHPHMDVQTAEFTASETLVVESHQAVELVAEGKY